MEQLNRGEHTMIIYVDMDDVLCDFSGARGKALLENPIIQSPQ